MFVYATCSTSTPNQIGQYLTSENFRIVATACAKVKLEEAVYSASTCPKIFITCIGASSCNSRPTNLHATSLQHKVKSNSRNIPLLMNTL